MAGLEVGAVVVADGVQVVHVVVGVGLFAGTFPRRPADVREYYGVRLVGDVGVGVECVVFVG